MPDPAGFPPCHRLEQLPYLTAVIKEAGRVTSGGSSRLSRIAPTESLRFQDWLIPAGTSVGMSQPLQHMNPSIFPEPRTFDPERWLQGQESVQLEQYLVNFGRGARSCVGINLAKAELYLVLAAVVRRFELEVFETERERDVDTKHDFFIPYASVESKGIRVLVKGSVGV
jgi:cytochrome P450